MQINCEFCGKTILRNHWKRRYCSEYCRCKAYKKQHPEILLEVNRKYRYGITQAQYEEMLLKQGGVCAICRGPETSKVNSKVKPLSVDHDHKTGKIRELLCSKCNHALGNIRDDLKIAEALIAYLRKFTV